MELHCDCGNVRLSVPVSAQLTSCNCLICQRYQALWGYYQLEQVSIVIGSAGKNTYQRGDREIEFVRCAECGCVTHYQTLSGDPDPILAVNFRMAEPMPTHIPVRYVNNASR